MTRVRTSSLLPAFGAAFLCLIVACAESNQAPADDGSGATSCGSQTCQPGQFCMAGVCEIGCLSGLNCAPMQFCDTAQTLPSGASRCVRMMPDAGVDARPRFDAGNDAGPTTCEVLITRALACGATTPGSREEDIRECEAELSPGQQALLLECAEGTCEAFLECVPED